MKLYKLKIQNFRKLNNVELTFGDATFLIGANNAGKSSTLDAVALLLSNQKLEIKDHSRYFDDEQDPDSIAVEDRNGVSSCIYAAERLNSILGSASDIQDKLFNLQLLLNRA